MQKTKFSVKNLWICIFRASRRVSFSYFPKVTLDKVCEWVTLDTFSNFCGSCFNIQLKPYATFKFELFVMKMAGNCC